MEIVDLIIKLVAIVGAVIAVSTYYKNARIERAKWLNVLYEKFYEKDIYKEMRMRLDYNTTEYYQLIESIKADTDPKEQEKLVDYLNFFEFIATLNKLNQLNINELNLVFGYYIKVIGNDADIVSFLQKHGFKNLYDLTKQIQLLRPD